MAENEKKYKYRQEIQQVSVPISFPSLLALFSSSLGIWFPASAPRGQEHASAQAFDSQDSCLVGKSVVVMAIECGRGRVDHL